MSRLFLSHSSANNAEAIAVRDWLASEGWNEVFLDLDPTSGIAAGERWQRALNEAASRCEAVLFLISQSWLESRWCLTEFNLARKLNKRLFGAIIDATQVDELPVELTGTWQVVDLASGQDHVMFRVVLPRNQEEAHVTFSKEGLTRLRAGLAKAGLDPRFFAWPPAHDPNRAPYRGLKPLEAEDAGMFFGRDAPIVEALDTLRGLREAAAPRLMVIIGASGAGKSSFLRAGLLPRLARDDRNFLPLPVIRPERAAISGEAGLLRSIETAFAGHGLAHSRAQLREIITGGAEKLRPLFAALVDKAFASILPEDRDAKRPVIVFAIDQAEELFAAEAGQEGQALLEIISDLVKEDRPAVLALFTIRSDSYDLLETARAFEGTRQRTMPLLPMPRGAYQTVIEGPAARLKDINRSLTIEPRLTQRLLEDIDQGGGSDALPLLAFTLEQLYLDYGGSGALKLADYEAFGGIRGAIEAAVQRALKAADADGRIPRDGDIRLVLLRRGLIPWLAGIDPESGSTRRRVARRSDIPAESAPLIDLLVEQRLLSTDRVIIREGGRERHETTIEPAHEALLRQWSLLRGWLQEDFAALTVLDAVKRAARGWGANDRKQDWLDHSGTRLEDAEKVAWRADLAGDLSAEGRDYLAACRAREQAVAQERLAREKRERRELVRTRILALVAGIGLLGAATLALLFSSQKQTAEAQKQIAEARLNSAIKYIKFEVEKVNGYIESGAVSTKAARELLSPAEQALQDLERIDASPLITTEQVRLLLTVSDAYVTLGDLNNSLSRAEAAKQLLAGMLKQAPTDIELQQLLYGSCFRIGDALVDARNWDRAQQEYDTALDIAKRFAAQTAPDPAWQLQLQFIHDKEGDLFKMRDDLPAALGHYRESLAIENNLIAADQGQAEFRHRLSGTLNRIGQVLVEQRKLNEALSEYQTALEISLKLALEDPQNYGRKLTLGVRYSRIGTTMQKLNRLDEAYDAFRSALDIRLRLKERDPTNALYLTHLASSYKDIGGLMMEKGDLDEAISNYERAYQIHEDLAARDSDNAAWLEAVTESKKRLDAAIARRAAGVTAQQPN